MQIFLTGKNGQVGFELQRALSPLGELVAVDQAECDLTDYERVRALIRDIRPDVIVHPAAYTAVDQAESDRETAFAVNGTAPALLADEAARLGALMVHYCTDYVYDGKGLTFYTEDDTPPNPLSVYGLSKLAGTQAVQRGTNKHLIFRTCWVFGAHGANFVKTILRLATERENLNVVADQFGSPTSAALIADVTAHVIRHYLYHGAERFPYGLYHLAASGVTTWFDFARTIVETAQRSGNSFKLTTEAINPISTTEYPLPAIRPANSRLSTQKLQQTFDLRLPPWQEGLEHVLRQIY